MKYAIIGLAGLMSTNLLAQEDQASNAGPNSVPGKRAHHAIIYHDELEKSFLFAGSTPVNDATAFVFYNDAWTYDGMWSFEGNFGDRRSGIALAYNTSNHRIYSFGGFANNTSLGDLREFDGSDWVSRGAHPEMTSAEGGLVYDSQHQRLLAFGGSHTRGQFNTSLWEWKNNTWKKLEADGPEGRAAFAMIYDSRRNRVVLFGGGVPGKKFGDTWEFDGKQWEKVSETGPDARMAMGFTYDSKRGLFIIFGGLGGSGMLADTWAWDGNGWNKLSDGGPDGRAMGYLTYDKKRDKVVLFGGRVKWPSDANDTWEWDGNRWIHILSP